MASSELGLGLGTQTATDPQAQTKYMLAVAKGNIKRGAGWFDVIAGLSVVNAILAMMGSWVFLAGLGITTVANQVGASFGTSGRAIGFIITLVAAGVFVMLGHFAKQGQTWALILGIVFLRSRYGAGSDLHDSGLAHDRLPRLCAVYDRQNIFGHQTLRAGERAGGCAGHHGLEPHFDQTRRDVACYV